MEELGSLRMADVGAKPRTARHALARGSLVMNARALRLLRTKRLPKGDALAAGELAGIMAAKRTSEIIPLCHPLPLDAVRVGFELDPKLPGLHAFCSAKAFSRTGVEMEALCGVSAALLTVYDLVKPVDPALRIDSVRLEFKAGGKSGFWRHPLARPKKSPPAKPLKPAVAGIITVSDRCSQGRRRDESGRLLSEGLRAMGLSTRPRLVVSDDQELIASALRRLAKDCDAVVLTGGTGLSPRDVTPETVTGICDRVVPGIGEALRLSGRSSTPLSSLSRSVAGLLGSTIVVCLPGSPRAVQEGLAVLSEVLPHAIHIAKGGGHGLK